MDELALAQRKERVLYAIAHIEDRDRHRRDVHSDARSSLDDRLGASEAFVAAEREFGWQWKNVKAILEAYDGK